jgi:hypothetical protein
MIDFLIYLVVLCIVFGLVYYIVTLLPIPQPFKNVAVIAVLLIFLLVLLAALFGTVTVPKLIWK